MKVFWIARRDLASYLNGMWGWTILAALLVVAGILFNIVALNEREQMSHQVLEQFFYTTGAVFNFAAILLSMRSFAEEKHTGTSVLLESSPISDLSIVLGKWLAVMGMLTLLAVLSGYMPALIFVNGKVALSHILVGYTGLLTMSGAVAALGVLASSLTRSQVVAGIVGGILATMFIAGFYLAELVEPPFVDIVESVGLYNNFMPFLEGRLLTSELLMFGSITFGALFLTTRVIEGRRWT